MLKTHICKQWVNMGRRMVRAGLDAEAIASTLDLCYFNPYTALALSMGVGKAMTDSLRDLEYSTVVRVMASATDTARLESCLAAIIPSTRTTSSA